MSLYTRNQYKAERARGVPARVALTHARQSYDVFARIERALRGVVLGK